MPWVGEGCFAGVLKLQNLTAKNILKLNSTYKGLPIAMIICFRNCREMKWSAPSNKCPKKSYSRLGKTSARHLNKFKIISSHPELTELIK